MGSVWRGPSPAEKDEWSRVRAVLLCANLSSKTVLLLPWSGTMARTRWRATTVSLSSPIWVAMAIFFTVCPAIRRAEAGYSTGTSSAVDQVCSREPYQVQTNPSRTSETESVIRGSQCCFAHPVSRRRLCSTA